MKSKKSKYILYIFYIFVILFFVGSFYLYKNMNTDVVKVEKIEFIDTEVSLKYGENYKIEYEIEPFNATSKRVTWESSNPELVEVDEDGNLIINSNASGEVTITAKSKVGKAQASFKVKVEKIDNEIKVVGVALNTNSLTLEYGKRSKLVATITPSNAANKNVTWTSSDPSLVTVDSKGNIKAVGNKDGSATITVKTADGGYTASAKVTVKGKKVTGIKLDKTTVSLKYGTSLKLTSTISPSNAANKNVTWTSSDSSLVVVDSNGNVVAASNKDGEAIITVKTADGGYTASAKVKVIKLDTTIKVTSIKVDKSTINLKYGESAKVTATVAPSKATNKNVIWTSSNASLVTVDSSGNIKAVGNKDGSATVTAKSVDGGYSASIKVTVTGIKVTRVSLDKEIITLKYNNTIKVNATVNPSNAANKNVTWISSNTSLVTVDSSGNIKAIANKDGSATITVKTADGGYTDSVKVTVTSIKVNGISLDKSSVSLKYGSTAKVTATIKPSNAANKKVTWTSSNTSLVTVDSSGNIKAVGNKDGSATVTAKSVDGGYSASIKVKVTSIKVTGVKLDKTSVSLKYATSAKLTATVSPSNAANKNVTWTSSNTSLVTVDGSGNIKAVANKDGSATITVKTADGGYSATAKVTVVKVIDVESIKLSKSHFQLNKGKTTQLSYAISPSNATDKTVSWKSSNSNVISVDKSGNLKALKNGISTITVTTSNGKKDSIIVNVISSTDLQLYKRITDFKKTEVIQNFLIINGELYTTHKEAYLNKHSSNGTTCVNFGETMGHMDSIDYEKASDGTIYLWSGCDATEKGNGMFSNKICRMKFNSIKFDSTCKLVNPSSFTVNQVNRSNHFAIDNSNNTIVVRGRDDNNNRQKLTVYDLNDFIKNYNSSKATPLLQFTVPYNQLPDKTYLNIFQNIEYENGYFYLYEGKTSTHTYNEGGYIQVTKYKLDLKNKKATLKASKRIKYQYSDSDWWQETEGIRVIGKELYIGIAIKKRKENGTGTTGGFQYEIYKVNGMGTYE